jgi:hypothetical protein
MTDERKNFTLDQPTYRLEPHEVARQLGTNFEKGLSKHEAKRRHGVVGDNALEGGEGVSIWIVLLRQVANALTLVSSLVLRSLTRRFRCWLWPWHCHTGQQISSKAE